MPEPVVVSRLAAVRTVAADRRLSRMLRALLAFGIAEEGGWLAVLLYAFGRGGIGEAGWVAVAMLLPAGGLAPVLAAAGDRFPRDRVLTVGFCLVGLALAATGGAALADAPAGVVYGLAAVYSVLLTFAGPAVSSVLPSLTTTADQLTAANVTVGIVQTLGQLIGPACVAVSLTAVSPGGAMVALAAVMLLGALATRGTVTVAAVVAHADDPPHGSTVAELSAGVRLLVRDRRARALATALTATSLVAGALDVGAAALAVEVLGRDEAVAGLLLTAFGVGALTGATVTIGLVGRRRLALVLGASVVVMAASFAGTGSSSALVLTVGLVAVVGAGARLATVVGRTMLQGLTPDDTLARLFGVLETLEVLALAAGGVLVSVIAVSIGIGEAFAVVAALSVIAVVVHIRTLAGIDADRRPLDPELLALARSSSIFGPLPPYAIEQIMHDLTPQTFAPHEVVLRRGEHGDRVFLVGTGVVVVDVGDGGRLVRGPGSHIGELAILHGAPRNADVTAGDDGATLYWMAGADFLDAIDRVPRSRARAEAEARRRLGDSGD